MAPPFTGIEDVSEVKYDPAKHRPAVQPREEWLRERIHFLIDEIQRLSDIDKEAASTIHDEFIIDYAIEIINLYSDLKSIPSIPMAFKRKLKGLKPGHNSFLDISAPIC